MLCHKLIIALLVAVAGAGCRKHDPLPVPEVKTVSTGQLQRGLPARLDSIHGFLVAENRFTTENSFNYAAARLAMFAQPGLPLLDHFSNLQVRVPNNNRFQGNIDVGKVLFGTSGVPGLNGNTVYNYFIESNAAHLALPEPVWKVEGNKSVSGFTVALGEWPALYDTVAIPTVTNSLPWSLDLGRICSGHDSVIVELRHQSSNLLSVSKRATPADTVLEFSKEELKSVYSFYPRISVRACSYYHMTIDGRLYIFELMRRFDKNITGTP